MSIYRAGAPNDMTETRRFAAEVLQASAVGYAAAAARQLLADQPAIKDKYGRDALGTWRELLTQRLLEVASAVRLGRPELFAARIEWLYNAFAARHGDVGDLASGLRALEGTLARDLPDNARAPIAECLALGIAVLGRPPSPTASRLDPADKCGRWALRYIAACLEGRREEALEVVLEEARGEIGAAAAYVDVLLPAQTEIGRLWHAGEITIAEEHIVSETTLHATILLSREPPAGRVERTVLTAAVAGNAHEIGIRAVTDFFRMAGWRTIALGSNAPAAEIARAAQSFGAHLVALSATLTTQLDPLQETISALREVDPAVKIMVGGHVFDATPELWRQVGADAYATRPDEGVRRAAELLGVRDQPA